MPATVDGAEYSSHGTSVSFGGVNLGRLIGFDSSAEVGELADATSAGSRLIGSGASSRVVTKYDCTVIDPPVLTLAVFGPPHYEPDDVGMQATLAFDAPGNMKSGAAILVGVNHTGRRGEYSEGSLRFQWIG